MKYNRYRSTNPLGDIGAIASSRLLIGLFNDAAYVARDIALWNSRVKL